MSTLLLSNEKQNSTLDTSLDQLRHKAASMLGKEVAKTLAKKDFERVLGDTDSTIEAMEKQLATIDSNDSDQDRAPEAPAGAPKGFPETTDVENELRELGAAGLSLRGRAKAALGLPNLYIAKGSIWLHGRTLAKREAYAKMTPEAQAAEQKRAERYGKIATWGAAGLTLAMSAARFYATRDVTMATGMYSTSYGDLRTMSSEKDLTVDGSAGGSTVATASENRVRGSEEYPQHEAAGGIFELPRSSDMFIYNPLEDPALSPEKKGNDFGPALSFDARDKQLGLPAGMTDLAANRWTNSPEEFATIMSKLGLVENDATSINDLAEQMKAHPETYQDNYIKVIQILTDPRTKIHEEAITAPYGSYYAVNGGGDAVIAYDNYVNHGGTMIVIETPDGKTICLRKECGGQPIDLLLQPKATQVRPVYQPQGGGEPALVADKPRVVVPEQPEKPTPTPEPSPEPTLEPQPEPEPEPQPEPETPLFPKGDRSPTNLDTIQGLGQRREPAAVADTQQTDAGGRDIGGGTIKAPVTESFRGTETDAEAGADTADSNKETVKTSGSTDSNNEQRTNSGEGAPSGPAE